MTEGACARILGNQNLYDILEIGSRSPASALTAKYKSWCIKYHPDKVSNLSESEKQIAEHHYDRINIAYQILRDTERRTAYDAGGLQAV